MYIKRSLKRTAAQRFVIAGAAVLLSAMLAACGGGDDAGIASTMGKGTMMAAKPGGPLESIAIPIQPNQSVTNLSSNGGDGSGELWYSLTLPVGTSAVKIATSGGSGRAQIFANTSPDPEIVVGNTGCMYQDICQFAFAPLTEPTTYYIKVATPTSYNNKTLTTYVTPEIIPLDSGMPINGLSGTGQDTLARFSINVPPGSKNFSIKVEPGLQSHGKAEFFLTRGTTDLTYAFSCGPGCTELNERNPIAATYYISVYPPERPGFSNWTLKATVE